MDFSLAIDDGWVPALIRSEANLEFIKAAMQYLPLTFILHWTFWIGGTSCSEQFSLFHYCACDEAGKNFCHSNMYVI